MAELSNRQNELNAVLIKPAGPDCNLSCDYCFYLEKAALFPSAKPHRMSPPVLYATMRQLMQLSAPHVSIGWQGGEPTLMGQPFFEQAIALQKRYGQGKRVGNSLQTNGLLIDARFAAFLGAYRFLVGLSIDGPPHVHDRYRRYRGGRPTYEETSEKARLLQEHGVQVNALSVVTDEAARFPDDIYESIKALGIDHHQYIPCVMPPPGTGLAPAPYAVTPEAFGRFLVRLFDLWRADFIGPRPTVSIRFFEAALSTYLGTPPSDCTLLQRCGVYLVVEHNGDVFPCDFFVARAEQLGNVQTDDLGRLFASDAMQAFGARKTQLPRRCHECPWLARCRGGCPKDRLPNSAPAAPSHLCDAFSHFFAHAHPHFKQMAAALRADEARQRRRAVIDAVRNGTIRASRNDACPCGSGKKFKKCCLQAAGERRAHSGGAGRRHPDQGEPR